MDEAKGVRLNKAISDTGFCSRREADKIIEQGRVSINGIKAVLGQRVMPTDTVEVDGKQISSAQATVYIAFNKPRGITCTTELHIKDNIINYINHPQRIFPVGRLDKASEGLIFLTSDGNIVNKILRAGNNHEKEYIVTVNRPTTTDFLDQMASGVPILDTVTAPCKVERIAPSIFKIILTQGLNRQIRRMCEALGYEVTKLRRTRIMNITLDGIKLGEWRYFTDAELAEVNRLVANSVKTEEASLKR
jgi:23S rRNA pseudouridine2604 synthase